MPCGQKVSVPAEQLTIEEGFICRVGDSARIMPLSDVARMAIFRAGGEGIFVKAT